VDTLGTSREEQDNDYLLDITDILGPLPPSFLARWVDRSDMVDEGGNILPRVAAEIESSSLEQLVMKFRPKDMNEHETTVFLDFLRCMLPFEPAERVLTDELLQHLWLRD